MVPLRAGLSGLVDPSAPEQATVETVGALLRTFMKDAIAVSGRYAHAHGRRVVTARDTRCALMYCARTFFEQDESVLARRVEDEVVEMGEEESEEEDSEDDEDSAEEEEASGEEVVTAAVSPEDAALARHVDAVVASWPRWEPTDPVHLLIKRAIDHVEAGTSA